MTQYDPIPLEPSVIGFKPAADRRPLIPVPPPVRLVAVADVLVSASAGLERDLDAFYMGLLRFERDPAREDICYRAENFRLVFEVVEGPVPRDDLRPTGIEVPFLRQLEHRLIDAEHEYARLKGLTPGHESLLLQDPAGNWVQLTETRPL